MRHLILACSATKRHDPGEIPAVDRYDGPAFRVLRANLETLYTERVLILSAEHGLIGFRRPIADYDRKMDPARARDLIDPTYEQVAKRVRGGGLRGEIFFYGGRLYRDCFRQAVQLAELELERDIPVTYSSGGIGQQLGQLKRFITA